jgi:hypothetical protein
MLVMVALQVMPGTDAQAEAIGAMRAGAIH